MGQQWYFPQNGAVPVALNIHLYIAAVLRNFYLGRIVTVALQKIKVHRVKVWAGLRQVRFFFPGKLQVAHGLYRQLQNRCKTFRKHMISAVNETVTGFCLWKQLYHSLLHSKLVKIIVQ